MLQLNSLKAPDKKPKNKIGITKADKVIISKVFKSFILLSSWLLIFPKTTLLNSHSIYAAPKITPKLAIIATRIFFSNAPIKIKNSPINKSSLGGYEILRTGDNIRLTIISSGSETSLACDISHKLATENIYSKVISMPCQELFDQQNKDYQNKIFERPGFIDSLTTIEKDLRAD